MRRAANDNRPKGQLSGVLHAERGDGLWSDIQAETRDRIGAATLRAMYADLLQEPLSPRLQKLIRQIRTQHETSRHAG